MIGVMAVISILAAVVFPVTLRSLDRAAVRTEKENLKAYAAAITDYVRYNSAFPAMTPIPAYPTPLPWSTALFTPMNFTSEAPINMRRNARNVDRVFIVEPGASPKRAILISGMREGLALPTVANLTASTAVFDAVWNTQDNAVPANGTGIWAAWAGWGDYLSIQRISVYAELQDVVVTLQNTSATVVSYEVLRTNGSPFVARTSIAGGAPPVVMVTLKPRMRVNLYTSPAALTPTISYVVTPDGKSFLYNSAWTAL
ncbi:type II secretion system protein [Nibricoccus sp. IMCC34717]|uniref:type II secretion system protein n=1 Tax=Nibricoccus sp. IMCC34717 TaxID=3034021 RepID=UPI00384D4618